MSAPNVRPRRSRAIRPGLVSAACLLLGACVGPEAPDAAVCQDLVHRLCASPVCNAVSSLDTPTCEVDALVRTGCDQASFEFTAPGRDHFLQCRALLLHDGTTADTHPDCAEVASLATTCPDVIDFIAGSAP